MEYRAKYYSKEDSTIKYVFDVPVRLTWTKTKSISSIESAFINIGGRNDDKPEHILCLSSQVGCIYGCLMCRNMVSSFYRCLAPDEINEQIRLTLDQDNNLEKIIKKGSVEHAFMAIGEPLYGMNVIEAIRRHEPYVPDTRFALSTVGAEGTIKRLSDSNPPFPVRLELSLHFSDDATRWRWILPKRLYLDKLPKLSINKMLAEAEEYSQKHPGKITLNYALIDGINNLDKNVEELSALLKGREDIFYVKVMKPNLTSSLVYSWKDVWHITDRTYPPKEFRDKLLEAGLEATLFESKGIDIAAGCGMMANNITNQTGPIEEIVIPQADPRKLGF